MGKYIKYFNNSAELSDWLNFGIPEAPGESAETAWVAYLYNSGYAELLYSSNDNSDYFIQAYFSECSYSSSTATFNVNKTVSYSSAEVYYDDTLIGTVNLPWLQQFTINVGVNDTPAPKQLVATVKFYRGGELIGTKVVTGEQSADPSLEPHAYATLTIVSDGINESKIGRSDLQRSASKVTCGSTDITQGWYESNGSMCYVFQDAGTYNVTIEYNSLSFMPDLTNTDATDVRYWTNNPEYAAQMGYELTGFVGDSPNITGVTIGDGLQVITTPPFLSMTNLKEMVFEDTSKLPALESWQFMMVPSGVTAYADENAENYDVWTSNTASANWTWKPNPISTPLTFEITSAGNIVWNDNNGLTIMYSKNGGDWLATSGVTTIPVVEGDVVQFKGDNASYGVQSFDGVTTACTTFSGTTCGFNLKGNIYSLSDSDDFNKVSSYQYVSSYAYKGMFCDCVGLESAANLSLPSLFLADGCYELMFYGCSNMTEAPYLPSTNLADYCYDQMFSFCQSLERAPELPAGTLAEYCYNGMFHSCSSLNYIKCLAIDISAYNCTAGWVEYVPSSGGGGSSDSSSSSDSGSDVPFAGGTFIKASGMNDWQFGDDGIPNGWTVVDA